MDIKMAFKAYAWSLFLHETMFMTSLLISAEKIMLLYLEDYGLKWEMNTWNLWNEAPVIMQMSLVTTKKIEKENCRKPVIYM